MVLDLHKNQAGVTVATLSRSLRSVQTNGTGSKQCRWRHYFGSFFTCCSSASRSRSSCSMIFLGVPSRRLVLVDFLDASSPERRDLRFKVLPCGRDTRISKFHVQSRSCHEPVWPPNAACGV